MFKCILLLLTFVTSAFANVNFVQFVPIFQNLSYSHPYTYTVNNSAEYLLHFYSNVTEMLKYPSTVTISSQEATVGTPLVIVVRQGRQVLTYELPFIASTESDHVVFNSTKRTLCLEVENLHNPFAITYFHPIVTVSTTSSVNVTFDIIVNFETNFYIETSNETNFIVAPNIPKFFYYNFTSSNNTDDNLDYDMVIVKTLSEDSGCMVVSIQNASCPILDPVEDIRAIYETVDTKGGAMITKHKFPNGFFVAFTPYGDNSKCSSNTPRKDGIKNVTVIVQPSISYNDYVFAINITVVPIVAIFIIVGIAFIIYIYRTYKSENNVVQDAGDSCNLIEANENIQQRSNANNLHLSNVFMVGVFYCLPVVQLVIYYQKILNQTGNLDMCYYNFFCAHPLGYLTDFNHVISNIAYVLFGGLFLVITFLRQKSCRNHGESQHFGMFYAMGVSLIVEGILSGCYHVCPTNLNFQFDSSFMYVMNVLCIVKLYQNRNKDLNIDEIANSTFGFLSIVILLAAIGIFKSNIYFLTIFNIFYIALSVYICTKLYFDDRVKRDMIRPNPELDQRQLSIREIVCRYPGSYALFAIACLSNIALALYGTIHTTSSFGMHLLMIFMLNSLLYFAFCITMKYINGKRLTKLCWLFLFLAVLFGSFALYFFLHNSNASEVTPAASRHYNKDCSLMHFYDYHDIWHFLSAVGMFFMFMTLLTLDDDVLHQQ